MSGDKRRVSGTRAPIVELMALLIDFSPSEGPRICRAAEQDGALLGYVAACRSRNDFRIVGAIDIPARGKRRSLIDEPSEQQSIERPKCVPSARRHCSKCREHPSSRTCNGKLSRFKRDGHLVKTQRQLITMISGARNDRPVSAARKLGKSAFLLRVIALSSEGNNHDRTASESTTVVVSFFFLLECVFCEATRAPLIVGAPRTPSIKCSVNTAKDSPDKT